MPATLSANQRRTYDSIFSHPMAHNVEWRDISSMLQALGEMEEAHNGNTKFTRNGQTLVLRPGGSGDGADPSSMMKIRHFLRASDKKIESASPGEQFLVVIDHREARIFKSERSGTAPEKIVPHDPHGFGQHVHNVHDPAEGQHHPVPKSYYEAVAKSLEGATEILLFGTGTGGGSAMNVLLDELHKNHRDLFDLVIGSQVVDETHLTEGQLLALAREFCAPAAE